ncbi:protease HtpX [Candidatus Profftella armatura (Diaphorina cf. continua)]|uniref:Protease HtpX n=1 Tax=Candidatus Profftella armatura (Diaphorina cf. continua) TaxID=2661583 RepID=A0A7R6VYM4_9PROT|nr:protease HtpX [Candidatus Profftella armatura (Diaphorina cf. continua)]BCG49523.1 protease HtpX [Candidatus Profftella armatura (Diaphorina cf. continua)]
MRRIFIFLITNIAIILVLNIMLSLLGIDYFFYKIGLNIKILTISSIIFGFTGSIISLLLSKQIAKWSMNLIIIKTPSNSIEYWLLKTVNKLSKKANIVTPEVTIYKGDINAFATGAFKNSSLIAISTNLLESMTKLEIEAIIAHEISHISNGDMITMTLIQGVINTFIIFISRIFSYILDDLLLNSDDDSNDNYNNKIYYLITTILQIFLGFGASIIVAWFSRNREFRADYGSAKLLGTSKPMISALRHLSNIFIVNDLPKSMAILGITNNFKKKSFLKLFSTHPSFEQRIVTLSNLYKS